MRRSFIQNPNLGVTLATSLLLGISHAKRQEKRLQTLPPTPEQIARRERAEWNAQVDARKAAKKGDSHDQ